MRRINRLNEIKMVGIENAVKWCKSVRKVETKC